MVMKRLPRGVHDMTAVQIAEWEAMNVPQSVKFDAVALIPISLALMQIEKDPTLGNEPRFWLPRAMSIFRHKQDEHLAAALRAIAK
jgi:hypothetical protein